jgi:hypothetical protein
LLKQYLSVCPLGAVEHDLDPTFFPLRLPEALSIEDVSPIMKETSFAPLVPQFYSQAESDQLSRIRYGIVRRFECIDDERPSEEEKSAAQLYKLYLGLKIVRPTSGRYQVLHYDMGQTTPRLPRGLRNDYATVPCDSDSLNGVRWNDLEELQRLAPGILTALSTSQAPISQAVQGLEVGYRADFLNVRHLLWVIGLDALFTSTEWENQGAEVSRNRIAHFVGKLEVYSDSRFEEFGLPRPKAPPLAQTLRDIYKLRNCFAHGAWPDRVWTGSVCRRSVDASRDIYYAELLSEAAVHVLRGCLKQILSDTELVALFNDKTRLNAHFLQLDMIRRRKSKGR